MSMSADKYYSFACVTCPDFVLFIRPFQLGYSIFCLYFNFLYICEWYRTGDESSDLFVVI